MAEYDDDEGSGIAKVAIAGVVILGLVGGAVYWFLSSSNGPQRQPAPPVVQLKLLPPPPPPPPPPKVPPPEPQKVVDTPKMVEPMKPVTASAPPKAPGPPPAGPLGLDAKGSGPGDAFGLHGGGGGDGDGGGGGGTVEGYYASQVKSALDECVAEDGRLSHATGRVQFIVHVDDDGNATGVDFQSRFDDSRDNTALEDIVHHCKMDAPPTDAPPQFNLHEIHIQLGAAPSHS